MSVFFALGFLWSSTGAPPPATPPSADAPLVDMAGAHPSFRLDIRYATDDNFAGRRIYPVARCLLRPEVARRMQQAQDWLDRKHRGFGLMFKDCYRPHSSQRILYNAVRGTKKARYVANPDTSTGSIHSYGAAVDVTLHRDGREVDMGTPYDHLGPLAEPRHERRFVRSGRLTKAQVFHRRILRRAMVEGAGMKIIRNEWWHYNVASAREVRKRYPRLDLPLTVDVPPAPKPALP